MDFIGNDNSDRIIEINEEINTYQTVVDMLASLLHMHQLSVKYDDALIKNSKCNDNKADTIISTVQRDIKCMMINELERIIKMYDKRLEREKEYLKNALDHTNKKQKLNHMCSIGLCKCSCELFDQYIQTNETNTQ